MLPLVSSFNGIKIVDVSLELTRTSTLGCTENDTLNCVCVYKRHVQRSKFGE